MKREDMLRHSQSTAGNMVPSVSPDRYRRLLADFDSPAAAADRQLVILAAKVGIVAPLAALRAFAGLLCA